MPRALVPLAQGCEELEAVTIIDLLRRAKVDVVTAGLDDQPVTASRKTVLLPDVELADVADDDFDLIALPGGLPGATNLEKDVRLAKLLKRTASSGKLVAAVCAAPAVLAAAGLLGGKRATAYPGVLEKRHLANTIITGEAVERDGNIITSRGPGTAMDFALTLIEALCGRQTRDEVESGLVRP